jgi:hypothetical protein
VTDRISLYTRFLYWVVYQLGTIQAFILVVMVNEPIWRSHDGRVKRLKDLSDNHLYNVHRLLLQAEQPDHIKLLQVTEEQHNRAIRQRYQLRPTRQFKHKSGD